MEIKEGTLGFTIPIQKPERKTQLEMTTQAVKKWRDDLPMADTGASATGPARRGFGATHVGSERIVRSAPFVVFV